MGAATAGLYYLWQVPGKSISVNLSLDVVDRLSLAVLEGFQALPRRGLEIGGLLLGKTRRSGELISVEVDDFEPLGCEHAVGPSYLLSATDRAALEDRIRWHKSKGEHSIVGFYRSHTRKGFAATMEDADVLSAYFSDRSNVFLLIHAQRDAPPTAGFVIWEGSHIRSMRPYLEFPFRRAALMADGEQILSQTSASLAASEKPAQAPPQPAVAETPELRSFATPGAWATVLARATVLAWATRLACASRWARASRWAAALRMPKLPVWTGSMLRRPKMPEGLSRLWRRTGPLKLDWLMAVAIVATALAASLLHPVHRPTPAPGRAGSRAARQSKFVAEPVITASIPEAPDAVSATTEAPKPTILAPTLMGEAARTSAPGAEPHGRTGDQTRASATIRSFAAAAPQSGLAASAAMPVLPKPPAVAGEPASYDELVSLASTTCEPELLQIPDPLVSVATSPVPLPHRGALLRELGLSGKSGKTAEFVPPTPIREPPTEVPPELRPRLKNQVAMNVKVYIDRDGKVTYAELLSKGTGPNRDLASLAVFASRQWEFSPARLGDETVPAEAILRFRFGPEVR